MKSLISFVVFFMVLKCGSAQLFKKIDSIRVYYLDLTYLNFTPISPDMLKGFPITKLVVIKDPVKLSLINEKMKLLKKTGTKFEYFDTHVLCEIFHNRRERSLIINNVKYYYFKSKIFEPEESLFELLYPQPQ